MEQSWTKGINLEREVMRVRVMGSVNILMVWMVMSDFEMVLGKCDKGIWLMDQLILKRN